MYKFREEEYDSIEDIFDDVRNDDYLYEQYLREALSGFAAFDILDGIAQGDSKLAEEIYEAADSLIEDEIEEVEE